MVEIYETNSPKETEKIGEKLANSVLEQGLCFVCLNGDLGAGKTAFVRGFASVLSPNSRVKSPTYTIVNEYLNGSTPVYHFDLYRFENDPDALWDIGFEDYLRNGHCIFEWAEFLPTDASSDNKITVNIEKINDNKRKITIERIK